MLSAQGIKYRSAPWALTSLRLFHIVLVVILGASSILAVAQRFGWSPVPQYSTVPSGLFFNSMAHGEILALAILSFIVWREYLYAIPLLPGLYLSDSRGAYASLFIGLVAHVTRSWMLTAIVILVGVDYFLLNMNHGDLQRLLIWRAAATNLTLFGNGIGSFWDLWMGAPAWQPQYVHNDYLQAMFELGIFAIIPFAGIAWAATKSRARAWPVLIAFLFMATFSMPMHLPFALVIGLVALACTITNMETYRCVSYS